MRMKLLLKYGADINACSDSKNTPLLIACLGSNRFEQIKFLLRNGADPSVKNAGGATALLRTAELGDTLSLRLFVDMGLNINENPWGFTPLMAATRMANWPIVNFLLDHGADPNIPDPINMSVVLWAAEQNQPKLVNRLLEKTNNINGIDSIAGMTPLMWATLNEYDNPQIMQALIDKGANVNAKAKDGSTALSWAMKKGNTKTVAVLRKAGALEK
jgi:ankyrin repeat protein